MNLFVTKLPDELRQADLESLFQPYVPASVKLISDRETGRSKGYGFVHIPDLQQALAAIKALDGKLVKTNRIVVKKAEDRRGPPANSLRPVPKSGGPGRNYFQNRTATQPLRQENPAPRRNGPSPAGAYAPYGFVERSGGKSKTEALHDRLNEGRYDIAFEVTWRTLTPTAANPCTDHSQPETCPSNENSEYRGYNRRWLTIDNRLAISPFTVKSAVANGVAAILGGCYRVQTQEVSHANIGEGQYPYIGAWKRYRVAMDKSKPGIVVENHIKPDGLRKITIQPVVEYYFDAPDLAGGGARLSPGESCYARPEAGKDRNRFKMFITPESMRPATGPPKPGEKRVTYYGPYRFGMDLTLKPGDLGKRHHHRFYENHGSKVLIELPRIHFLKDSAALEKFVYVGRFKRQDPARDHRESLDGGPWFQNLSDLKPGEWVYFHQLGPKVAGIGKNFQFKTLFMHEDAVPEGNRLCKDPNLLCPRCSLFGMTAPDGQDANGLRGRFKASALCSRVPLTAKVEAADIPRFGEKGLELTPIKVTALESGGEVVCRQLLLPIQGPAKPSKRDVNGYFTSSGDIKGAKVYPHASRSVRTLEMLSDFIKETDRRTTNHEDGEMPYAHHLRTYAQVCREGVEFSGVLGAENCSLDEVSALVLLLEREIADYGFKIGLGKASGLGSVASRISTIWVRTPGNYDTWIRIGGGERLKPKEMLQCLEKIIPGVSKEVSGRKDTLNKLCRIEGMAARKPEYPKPGSRYWADFREMGI
jgi:hypothetical protein